MFRLAQERENYLREKERNKQKLNQTYQYQIKHRIPELPKHYSDNEVSYNNLSKSYPLLTDIGHFLQN